MLDCRMRLGLRGDIYGSEQEGSADRMKRSTVAVLVLLIGLAAVSAEGSAVQTATLTVCPSGCQYSSIQTALSAARDGDVISIGPGTYVESLAITAERTFPSPVTATTLTLMGAGAGQTTIVNDGTSADGNVILIANGYNVSISGVTLMGGPGMLQFGSGISMGNSVTLTLHDSVVRNNTANYGAGLFIGAGSMVTLVDTQVIGNTAQDTGGGIWTTNSTLTLIDSTVTGNTAGSSGGGIINFDGIVRLQSSVVTGNTPDNCVGATC
jgi:hypothetical protein